MTAQIQPDHLKNHGSGPGGRTVDSCTGLSASLIGSGSELRIVLKCSTYHTIHAVMIYTHNVHYRSTVYQLLIDKGGTSRGTTRRLLRLTSIS